MSHDQAVETYHQDLTVQQLSGLSIIQADTDRHQADMDGYQADTDTSQADKLKSDEAHMNQIARYSHDNFPFDGEGYICTGALRLKHGYTSG